MAYETPGPIPRGVGVNEIQAVLAKLTDEDLLLAINMSVCHLVDGSLVKAPVVEVGSFEPMIPGVTDGETVACCVFGLNDSIKRRTRVHISVEDDYALSAD